MKLWRVTVTMEASVFVVAEDRDGAEEVAEENARDIFRDCDPDTHASAGPADTIGYAERGDLPYVSDDLRGERSEDWTVGQWETFLASSATDLASRTDDQTIPLALPYPDGRVERVARVTLPAPDAPEEVL